MPLSEEEARLLAQLEQSLAEEDPDFASTLRGSKAAAKNRKIVVLSGLGFAVGVLLLIAGAVTASTWIGVIGFVAMVGAAYFFVRAWNRGPLTAPEVPRPSSSSPKSPGSFVDRMEERWQRRRDEGA